MNDDAGSQGEPRVLTIIELCLSDGRGGLEGYAAGLVGRLAARGHTVRVVTRPQSEFSRLSGVASAMEITPTRRAPWRGARRLARLARDADVIHIHRSADLPLAALAKRLAGNRPALFYTRHMAITRNRKRSPVHRWMHREVNLLLVVTERLAAQARERLPLPPERIRVLPLGISPAPPPADCREVRPPGRDFVIGCFSRIEPAKGQHELLAALARLVAYGVNAAALIAGPVMSPAYAAELGDACEALGVTERVRYAGVIADVRPVMACCDAVVMPSAAETFGLVLLEAMQMGVTVVCTAAGGTEEIVSDGVTGLSYPPGEVGALAACLERLARNPELAHRLARAGQDFVRERFNLDLHLDRLEALYRSARPRTVQAGAIR